VVVVVHTAGRQRNARHATELRHPARPSNHPRSRKTPVKPRNHPQPSSALSTLPGSGNHTHTCVKAAHFASGIVEG
jgi:hypothetical protein